MHVIRMEGGTPLPPMYGCLRRARARSSDFVGNFVGSFVDKAPDEVPDKVRSKDAMQIRRF